MNAANKERLFKLKIKQKDLMFFITESFCFLIKQVVFDIIPKQHFTSTDKTDEENVALTFIKYIFSFYC